MNCPSCKRETEPTLFCHFCDVYMSNPIAGTKAGVARRFAALLLDGVAIWVIFFIVLALAGTAGVATWFWATIGYVVFALWFLSQGKTPGKWMAGIRVADKREGSVPGMGRMLVREIVGKFVSGLFLGIGYFWAIFDKEGQAWHDKIAGTVVTRQPAGGYAPQPMVMAAAAGSSVPQGAARFCSACGATIQAASQFCANCGSRS